MAVSKIFNNGFIIDKLQYVDDLDDAQPISDRNALQAYGYMNTAANRPSTSGGTVFVITGSDHSKYTQIAFTNSSAGPRIDARNYGISGLTAWVNIIAPS